MRKVGCPFLSKENCPHICTVMERPSRCLIYDDANDCSKAIAKKKRMKRNQKRKLRKWNRMWMNILYGV